MKKNKKATSLTLSVIVVSYNTASLTLQTLVSVVKSLEKSPQLLKQSEIIVVDNNSQDDSVAQVKKLAKNLKSKIELTLIENSDNQGFAQANNLAADQAQGKYLLLLNSDTIVQDQALYQLVKQMEDHPQLGIGAAKLLNQDGSIQAQGGDLPSVWSLLGHYWFLAQLPLIGKFIPSTQHTGRNSQTAKYDQPILEQGWVGGTALIIPRQLYQQLGQLDSQIFMYGEDVELCLRAHQAGYKTGIITQAEITHLGSASSSSLNALQGEIKGYFYIFEKHFSSLEMKAARFIIKFGVILRTWLFGKILKDEKKAQAYHQIKNQL